MVVPALRAGRRAQRWFHGDSWVAGTTIPRHLQNTQWQPAESVAAGWFVPAFGTLANFVIWFQSQCGSAGKNHPAATEHCFAGAVTIRQPRFVG